MKGNGRKIWKPLLLLAFVLGMMFAMTTAAGAWSDGDGTECPYCGATNHEDWVCDDCGGCSISAERGDCYSENHCDACGYCFSLLGENYYCMECSMCCGCFDGSEHCRACGEGCGSRMICDCHYCEECLEGDDLICFSCGKCVVCEEWTHDDLCGNCHFCKECALICPYCGDACTGCDDGACVECGCCSSCAGNNWCENCGQCGGCFSQPHCIACGSCEYEICDCWICFDCLEFHNMFCPGCDECMNCSRISLDDCCECGLCPDCAEIICENGDNCMVCADGEICLGCGLCSDCTSVICSGCGSSCSECGQICPNCSMCSECGGFCQMCEEYCSNCASLCPSCGVCENCATFCAGCGQVCAECAEICGGCDLCWDCTEICEGCGEACPECSELCVDCGLCRDCGEELCENCDRCEYCCEKCLDCGFCEDCCLENSEAAGCDHGICVESAEWEEHFCVDCGECYEFEELCEDCGDPRCYDCCETRSAEEGCDHGVCMESGDWEDHFCPDCWSCIEDYCDLCDRCLTCCEMEKEDAGCEHDFTCPGAGDWDDHFCPDCDGCFELDELCEWCGLCPDCCSRNSPCECGEDMCIEDLDWSDHFCGICDTCLDLCGCEPCEHGTLLPGWSSDGTRHWKVCADCGINLKKTAHVEGEWVVDRAATSRLPGSRHLECSICGYAMKTQSILYMTHTCAGTGRQVYYDADYHWDLCKSCGKTLNKETHTIESDHRCPTCGYCDLEPPVFVQQPKDVELIPGPYDENSHYYISFTAQAVGTDLTYEWYSDEYDMSETVLGTGPVLKLDLADLGYFDNRSIDCRDNTFDVYCRVTDGGGQEESSQHACITVRHNHAVWTPGTGSTDDTCAENVHQLYCDYCDTSYILLGTDANGQDIRTKKHDYAGGDVCAVCGYQRPPRIVSQPYTIKPTFRKDGDFVEFKVVARGANLQYQWYWNDQSLADYPYITENWDTDTLRVNLTDVLCSEYMNGEYHHIYCVIRNDSGSVTTKTVELIPQHYYGSWKPISNTQHQRTCVNCALQWQTAEEVADHDPNSRWRTITPPTQTTEGVSGYYCPVCGFTGETKAIPKLTVPEGHVHDEQLVTRNNATHHWMECSSCGGHVDYAQHAWEDWVVEGDVWRRACSGCDWNESYTFDRVAYNSLQHWKCDADGNICPGSMENHVISDWIVEDEPTEELYGYETRHCTVEGCVWSEGRGIAKLPHVHSAEETYAYDELCHWHICRCGEQQGRTYAHRYGPIQITKVPTATRTGTGTRTCTECGYAMTLTLDKLDYPVKVTYGSADQKVYYFGDKVTITAIERPCMKFSEWSVVEGGASLAASDKATTTFNMPSNPVALEALYTSNGVEIASVSEESGTISYQIKTGDYAGTAQMIAAQYENGRLIDVKTVTISIASSTSLRGELSGFTPKAGRTYKVLLVTPDNCVAICDAADAE